MPYLSRICIYPLKALDALELKSATILASGALAYKGITDRCFALLDEDEKFVNGKRNPRVHRLRTRFEVATRTLAVRVQDTEQEYTFQIDTEREQFEAWFSAYFARPVRLAENAAVGFPDDMQAPGPTVISTETLQTVASWFPDVDKRTFRLRFRANLEIAGLPAFWEDRLFSVAGEVVQFRIGDVLLEGTNPCQRCVVPSRDPQTGEIAPQFQQIFMRRRQETLPAWATTSRFNHFYRLSCNTCISPSQEGKQLSLGDEVYLL